jgi:hypothetical protein
MGRHLRLGGTVQVDRQIPADGAQGATSAGPGAGEHTGSVFLGTFTATISG